MSQRYYERLNQSLSLLAGFPVHQTPAFGLIWLLTWSAAASCDICSAAFLKERLFDVSDAYRVHVCERSGLIAVANLKKQTFSSQIYKNDSSIVQVFMPYACKLLFQELMAMCIVPRMQFGD